MFLYQHSGLADITDTIRAHRRAASARARRARRWPTDRGVDRDDPAAGRRQAAAAHAARLRPRRRNASRHLRERRRRVSARHARRRRRHERVCRRQAPEHSGDDRARARARPDVILEIGIDTASANGRNLARVGRARVRSRRAEHRIYQLRGDEHDEPWTAIAAAMRRCRRSRFTRRHSSTLDPILRFYENPGFVELGQRQRVDAARAQTGSIDRHRRVC